MPERPEKHHDIISLRRLIQAAIKHHTLMNNAVSEPQHNSYCVYSALRVFN